MVKRIRKNEERDVSRYTLFNVIISMAQQTDTFANDSIQDYLSRLFLNKFIRLKAICENKNMKRFYTLHIHRIFFQEITVSLFYGRIGCNPQTRHYYF